MFPLTPAFMLVWYSAYPRPYDSPRTSTKWTALYPELLFKITANVQIVQQERQQMAQYVQFPIWLLQVHVLAPAIYHQRQQSFRTVPARMVLYVSCDSV